jgi:pimeloyl-ACP methyl ester carboxylesterase
MKLIIALTILIVTSMNNAVGQNGEYADINGLNMYYEIYGTGQPLVLIHGAASTIQTTFGRLIPELAKKYKIIAMELQAHGHSNNRDGRQITFEQDADDVAALMEQLHISHADFYGFSNGGTTALQIAIRHPALVRKLIFASSMYKKAGVSPAFWQGFNNAKMETMPDIYKQTFSAINPDTDALTTMFNQCVGRMQHFTDIPDSMIRAIQVPTLILLGDHDVPLPEHGVEMYRLMPQASLAIFPGGHGGYMGEIMGLKDAHHRPEALPVIEDFLDK